MAVRRILTLDGGGVRGIISAIWLAELEARLQAAGKGGLRERFDLIAGSSTGALIAMGIGIGLRAEQLVELYEGFGERVFPGGPQRLWSRVTRVFSEGLSAPKYDPEGLEKILKQTFGAYVMNDLRPRLMVVAYDTVQREPVMFKSYEPQFAGFPVWEACRASTAAPTYFPAHLATVERRRRALIDGGVVANNPTACAIAEAVKLNGDDRLDDLVLLSVGTGEATRPISEAEATSWGALEWAVPIIDVLFDGSADAVHYIATHLLRDGHYFRLQTPLVLGYDDFDNADRTNMLALQHTAREYLGKRETGRILDQLVKRL